MPALPVLDHVGQSGAMSLIDSKLFGADGALSGVETASSR